MKAFRVKEAAGKKIRNCPGYTGIPLIVVLAPLFILITLLILLVVWLKGDRSALRQEATLTDTWSDWSRPTNSGCACAAFVRARSPTCRRMDGTNRSRRQQPLFYAETSPPISPVHGAILSGFRVQKGNGFIVQRLWFVEDEDPALDSELVFIDEQTAESQIVTCSGLICFAANRLSRA
ncbi:MAG: hypothetical protein R3B47_16340 [Bacteroidia bacterium]